MTQLEWLGLAKPERGPERKQTIVMVAPPLVFPRAWWPVFLWKLKSMEKNLCNTFLGKPTKVNARVASPSRDSVLPLFEEIEQELLETFSPDLDLF